MSLLSPSMIPTEELDLQRAYLGSFVDGDWVSAIREPVTINAMIQHANSHDVVMMMEADRVKSWVKVYSVDEIKQKVEGKWESDIFQWENFTYQVMSLRVNKTGILNHYKAMACRISNNTLKGAV